MPLRQSLLLILALTGLSHGMTYQKLSTPQKVKSNLCSVAPLFASSILPFYSFLCSFGFSFFVIFLSVSICLFFTSSIFTSSYLHQNLPSFYLPHLFINMPLHHFVYSLFLSPTYSAKVKTNTTDTVYGARERNVHKYLHKTFPYSSGLVIFSSTLPPPKEKY